MAFKVRPKSGADFLFFDRELRWKFLKEALLLLFLLFLAWNQVQKVAKNVHEQNLFQIEEKKLQKELKMFTVKVMRSK